MLDMIGPGKANMVSLSDLRSCPMTPIFFDTFFNLEKYLDHEQRDPFASQRDMDEDGNEVIKNNLITKLLSTVKYQIDLLLQIFETSSFISRCLTGTVSLPRSMSC